MVKFSLTFQPIFPLKEYIRLSRIAEDLGFDMLFAADDLMMKPVWPILTLMAEHTSRVQVGTSIVHPYLRHPALIAGYIAEIDELSNKRAILGIGRGAFYEFLEMVPEKPITAVREAVEIVLRLLKGDRTPYHGVLFSATEEAFLRWKPPRSRIPISIGTWGPKMAELAGEIADEVKAFGMWNLGYLTMIKEHMYQGARRARRDPKKVTLAVGSVCSISRDRAAAVKRARESLAIYLPYLNPMPSFVGIDDGLVAAVREAGKTGDFRRGARYITEEMIRHFGLAGRPEEFIEPIERMIEAGVGHISFGPPLGPDREEAVKLLGRKVLPHFKR